MELVLSPGFIGDNDGSPFHNEDVHEWSHVDRLTGMLENARIETGRWQARNHEAAQSYGKVIDSRERNSADGNVVQKAQRKVEIFQSQGVGGKSIQVVRASQWSSSRVSDLIHSSPLAKSAIEHHMSELDNSIKSRLNDWGLSKDLDPLSSLCRKIHSEVVNDSHSLLFGQSSAFLTDQKLSKTFDVIDRNKYSTPLFNEKKSNSNEDLASLLEEEDYPSSLNFSRDYRMRRSLQLSNKRNGKDQIYTGVKLENSNNSEKDLHISKLSELKNPQARLRTKAHLDEDNYVKDSYSSPESSPRMTYFGRNSFSRSRSPGTLISSKTNVLASSKPLTYFFKDPPEKNRESNMEIQKPTSIRLCAQESRPVASNKTIVHLGKPEDDSTGLRKLTIDLKNTLDNETTRDSNAQDNNVLFFTDCSAKPTKKVGFCKTEVHFVADSGKVNIVETDGKPPPTNRFRRRRRNSSNNSLGINANKNLPVIHFGDTSYEKYIFGASKKRVSDESQNGVKLREEEDYKDSWQSSLKSSLNLENEGELKKDYGTENDLINTHDKILDQRHKGHTTTVNFGANGFCNLRSVIRDETSKLSNVEEVSLEAPKIISALDLMTRKDDHKSRVENVEMITEDNEIMVKPLALHRPVVARVDFDHLPKSIKSVKRPITLSSLYPVEKINEEDKISRLVKPEVEKISLRLMTSNDVDKISPRLVKLNDVEKISPRLIKSNKLEKEISESGVPVTQETKDFCDVSSGAKEEICDPSSFSPIYANIFDSVRKDVPIYENFQAARNNSETEIGSKKIKEDEKQETKVEPSKMEQEEVPRKIQTQTKQKSNNIKNCSESKNKSTIDSTKSSSIKRNKKNAIVSKEKKNESLDKPKRISNKTSERDSCDKIKIQRIRENKNTEDGNLRNSKISSVKKELKRTGSKTRNSTCQPESGSEMNTKEETAKSTRLKKPVEVVYKTAVYNMKNEKLTKPTKTKESKGPRYINDIICGSKERKPSTDKVTKTCTTPQKKSDKGN